MDDAASLALFRLRDGRVLSYAERGAADGFPVFQFHGVGGCRLERPEGVAPGIPERAGVRLISVDRPGYGESTRRRGRRVVDWPEDVAQLADALGLDRFGVSAWSMGGPHALACGYAMPERVVAVAVISGAAPPDATNLLADYPPGIRLAVRLCAVPPLDSGYQLLARRVLRRHPQLALASLARRSICARPDQELLSGRRGALMLEDFREASRNGVGGIVDDYRSDDAGWGFRLEDVPVPVCWVHGEVDATVPLKHARSAAARIPRAEFVVAEGEGHMLSAGHLLSAWSWLAHAATQPALGRT